MDFVTSVAKRQSSTILIFPTLFLANHFNNSLKGAGQMISEIIQMLVYGIWHGLVQKSFKLAFQVQIEERSISSLLDEILTPRGF